MPSTRHHLTRDLLAGALLFLLTAGFFWRPLSGDVVQPADGGDLVSFLYPTYRFAAAQLASGSLPWWNPHLYGGAPFVGDIQAGFLYLPNLARFWLNPEFPYRALQSLAIGHLFWAGLGMYVLLRTLRWPTAPVARPAALLGAIAFQFSDPLLIHLGNLNLIAVLSWLPWILAATWRGLQGGGWGWFGLAGLLYALANYAGHAQSSLYIAMALAVLTVLHVWTTGGGEAGTATPAWRTRLQPLLALALTVTIAALLTAPILLPALEMAGYTERSDLAYQETVAFSLAPTQIVGLLTPGFFGRGPALHWSLWERVETPYAGVATLLLAIAGLLFTGAAARRRLWPWLGLAVFGLLVGLGIYAIVHGWLTVLAPGFGQLRAPARALVLWTLGIAVLAALGLDRLMAQPGGGGEAAAPGQRLYDRLLAAGALILAGVVVPLTYLALLLTQQDDAAFLRASLAALALVLATAFWLIAWALIAARRAGWMTAATFAGLLIALLFFDLAATGAYTDISEADPTAGFQHPELVAFLRGDPDLFRIDARTDIDDLWQPDSAALHGLQDVWGVANPLMLRHWAALWEATGGRASRRYDMLNAKYVLVRDGTPLPEGKFELAFDAPGELAVYRNQGWLPRSWLVHAATPAADADQALARIAQDAGFDPTQQVIVQVDAPPPDLAPASGPEQVTVTDYAADRLAAQVTASAPAYLVLSEVWYPGWQATVNGQPAAVVQANGALRAVAVPAGESTVELYFTSPRWQVGLALAAVGLLAAAVLLAVGRWLRR